MSCLSLSGWLYTPETGGKGKISVTLNGMTQFPFLSSMVVTETYLPGVELYKCCLRTNTYFQVIKGLPFFSYCSVISNSQKALGFQEHFVCPVIEVISSSVVMVAEHFRNVHSLLAFPSVLFVGGESLGVTFFAHFLTLSSLESLLQVIYIRIKNPVLMDQYGQVSLWFCVETLLYHFLGELKFSCSMRFRLSEILAFPFSLTFPVSFQYWQDLLLIWLPLIFLPDHPSRTHLHHCIDLFCSRFFAAESKGWSGL